MSQSRMTIEQYIQITDWLRENKDRIGTMESTQLEVASLVTGALGFTVPLSSIQKCAKIVGIKWAKSPPPLPPVPVDHEAIVILIGAIEGLYIETSKTVPDNLANLHSRYVKEVIPEPKEPELDKKQI